MFSPKHPAFGRIPPKLARAKAELDRLDKVQTPKTPDNLWFYIKGLAGTVADVYNGMEDVLKDIAETVDGTVPPQGVRWHQDLIDQMSTPIEGVREAVMSPDLAAAMTELKGFRHVVRHNYGMDLDRARTEENYRLMTDTFPKFVEAVSILDRKLAEEPDGPTVPTKSP